MRKGIREQMEDSKHFESLEETHAYLERAFWYSPRSPYNVINDWVVMHPDTQCIHTMGFKLLSKELGSI